MNLKLTKAEVQALEKLLAQIIGSSHMDMGDKLLVCVLTNLYKKLVVKLLDLKNRYSVKLDEPTELAFYLYFEGEHCNPANFTDNLVKKICDSINQKHSL